MTHIRPNNWFTCRANGRKAEIGIFQEIGAFGITAEDFVAELRGIGNVADIDLHINSAGGNVFDGLAIYNTLKSHKARVTVYVDGIAASIASVIAMAGDEIVMPANAWLMIHDPSGATFGPADEHDKMADTLRGIKQSIAGIYTARTKQPAERIEAMMSATTWMNGQEAFDLGFATRVIEEQAIAASLDLTRFENVPEPVRRRFGANGAPISQKGAPPMPDGTQKTGSAPETTSKDYTLAAIKCGRTLGLVAEAEKLLADPEINQARIPELLIDIKAQRDHEASVIKNLVPTGASVGFHSGTERKAIVDQLADEISGRGGKGFLAIWRDHLSQAGLTVGGMNREDVVNAALHTSSDFPGLAGNAVHKELVRGYEENPSPLKRVCYISNFDDFLDHQSLGLERGPLKPLNEAGEVERTTMSEKVETGRLKTSAAIFGATRELLINDRLSALGEYARNGAAAASATEGNTIWSVVDTNAALSDGVALFHTSHANVAASGGAISDTTLGAAIAAMRQQQTFAGEYVAVDPRFLVVGPANEVAARKNVSAIYADSVDNANPFASQLEVIVEPRIGAATTWFVFSRPETAPVLRLGYLSGQAGPQVMVKDGWNTLGVEFRVVFDVGCFAVDHRGAFRDAGS